MCLQSDNNNLWRNRYDDSLKEAEILGCRKSWIFGLFRGFSMGIIFLLFSIAIWFSWLLITKIDPAFSSGSLFTVFFCVIMGSIYLGRASPYLSTLGLARVSAAVVFSTIDGVSEFKLLHYLLWLFLTKLIRNQWSTVVPKLDIAPMAWLAMLNLTMLIFIILCEKLQR